MSATKSSPTARVRRRQRRARRAIRRCNRTTHPDNAVTVFRAWLSRAVEEEAQARGLDVIDATCPAGAAGSWSRAAPCTARWRAVNVIVRICEHVDVRGTLEEIAGEPLDARNPWSWRVRARCAPRSTERPAGVSVLCDPTTTALRRMIHRSIHRPLKGTLPAIHSAPTSKTICL